MANKRNKHRRKPKTTAPKRTNNTGEAKAFDTDAYSLRVLVDSSEDSERRVELGIALLRRKPALAVPHLKELARNEKLPAKLMDRLVRALSRYDIPPDKKKNAPKPDKQEDTPTQDRTVREIERDWPKNGSPRAIAEHSRALLAELKASKQARLEAWRHYGDGLLEPEVEILLEQHAVRDGIKPEGWEPEPR